MGPKTEAVVELEPAEAADWPDLRDANAKVEELAANALQAREEGRTTAFPQDLKSLR